MVEGLLGMHKALGSIPNTGKYFNILFLYIDSTWLATNAQDYRVIFKAICMSPEYLQLSIMSHPF